MTTPQIPDPIVVERILAAMDRYPFATLALVLMTAFVAASFALATYLKRKP